MLLHSLQRFHLSPSVRAPSKSRQSRFSDSPIQRRSFILASASPSPSKKNKMVAKTDPSAKDALFLKSPRELFLLFSGGEVTTAKPKPDSIPEPIVETVDLAVKSVSHGNTVLTNHTSWMDRLKLFGENSLFGGHSKDLAKDPNLICLKASLTIDRKDLDIGGESIDVADPISDFVELQNELINNHVTLQLVSNDVDPATGSGKLSGTMTFEHWTRARDLFIPTVFKFNMAFYVPKDFGVPGAIIVDNGHRNVVVLLSKITITNEFYLKSASVEMPDKSIVNFHCGSWVYPTEMSKHGRAGRVFFSDKIYTPSNTPAGLVNLRAQELQDLQGDGKGERKLSDRIYDYDVYNDLGTPTDPRPTLGGSAQYPYPRRCRTGRPMNPDGKTETRVAGLENNYIPRDERFDDVKFSGFAGNTLEAKNHMIVSNLFDHDKDFESLKEVFELYAPPNEESLVETITSHHAQPFELLRTFSDPAGDDKNIFKYPAPRVIAADKDAWSKDLEFARQILAGMNPLMIELVKEFPLKSKLNVDYDPTSAITQEHIEPQLEGLRIATALEKKKLFVLDYHDRFMGYIDRINDLKDSAAYASRTLLFLTSEGILKPVAIELTLPPRNAGDKPKSRVFTPSPKGATRDWAWELAKAHVLSNDGSFHQVISHWLRTHAAIEPFIIASNRQLSILHPVYKALVSHFRNTMDINQAARHTLVNYGGIVEQTFTPQKYAMEISSVVYSGWRFVDQALPNDLIKRGMAVPAPNAPHGLKLIIEDYPFANDGLELWSAIRTWVKEHIDIFYVDDRAVQTDVEIQNWWTDLRTKGHPDVTEGWILADSKDNLTQIVTTIIWVASCHHAAVNFGQYAYAGFMPNHPSMTRKLIPEPDTPEWEDLQNSPQKFLLSMLSNSVQAKVNMTTIEILSTHAPNEEYLGQRPSGWTSDPQVLAVFANFAKQIDYIDALIKTRNADPSLKNRQGPTKVPYELLQPKSGSGLTGMGIPNSVSI